MRDIKVIFWNVNELNDKRANSAHLLPQIGDKNVKWDMRCSSSRFLKEFYRERALLSRFTHDPTVGGLRGEKGKRSTRNRLRVDSDFSEFLQTPRGRISPYLGFIPIIKCFTNVSVV